VAEGRQFASNGHYRRYLGVVSCGWVNLPGSSLAGASVPARKDPQEHRGPRGQVFVRGVVNRNRALEAERNRIAVVMIRLARFGARKQPYYRIVVIEKDRARNGRSIEVVGTYNPRTNPATVDLKLERVTYWRGVGAQLSPRVAKLLAKYPAPAAETAAA